MNDYMIKTERGYEDFETVRRVNKKILYYIETDNNSLKCTEDHRLLVGKSKSGKIFRQAKNLKVGDKISNGVIKNITHKEGAFEFYDVVGVSGHTYTTNMIESHNCNIIYTDEAGYIKSKDWDDFIDAVIPTMNSLIFKQVINTSTANGMNHFFQLVEGAKNINFKDEEVVLSEDDAIEIDALGEFSLEEIYKEFHTIERHPIIMDVE